MLLAGVDPGVAETSEPVTSATKHPPPTTHSFPPANRALYKPVRCCRSPVDLQQPGNCCIECKSIILLDSFLLPHSVI